MTGALAIAAHVVAACGMWTADAPWGEVDIAGTPHGWVVDLIAHRVILRPVEFHPPRQDLTVGSVTVG